MDSDRYLSAPTKILWHSKVFLDSFSFDYREKIKIGLSSKHSLALPAFLAMTNALATSLLLLAASLSPLEAQSSNFRPDGAQLSTITQFHSSDAPAILSTSSRSLSEEVDAAVEAGRDLERRRMDAGDESIEAAHVPFVVCSLDEQILGSDRRQVRTRSPPSPGLHLPWP